MGRGHRKIYPFALTEDFREVIALSTQPPTSPTTDGTAVSLPGSEKVSRLGKRMEERRVAAGTAQLFSPESARKFGSHTT